MTKAIAITTINPPSKSLIEFSKLKKFRLFVAGDNKTPENWKLKNTTFLSLKDQYAMYKDFAKLISQNHYARKNMAYLAAIKSGANYIYETDDDNVPYDIFPNFYEKKVEVSEVNSGKVLNIYRLFTKQNIWPRGLPLNYIKPKKYTTKKVRIEPLIQQSLADLDPDVDAIYRMTIYKKISFTSNLSYALAKHNYCPFNSQNTYWYKKVFALLYLPSTVESRVTDIWRGYIAQRILWELNSEMIFLSPSVYQQRNIHNFMKDFEQEADLYSKSEKLIDLLEQTNLQGSLENMLINVYKILVKNKFFREKELFILDEWINTMS